MEKIGIVTVLYNSESVLDEFFATLNEQTYKNFILYVIDNKSPDNSLEKSRGLAKKYPFDTVIIANENNDGVARGNNIGIEKALNDGCDLVLLSNNDVVFEPKTIELLLDGLNETKADIVVPKIYYHGTNLIWAVGGNFRKFHGDVKHIGTRVEDVGQFEDDFQVEYAPTCFMLLKKSVFEKIGIMDEKYFVYYDDTDFMYRAKKAGVKTFYVHKSRLWHKESVSTGVMSYFTVYHCNRNLMYFMLKNRGLLAFVWIIFVKIFTILFWHSFTYNKTCRQAERKGFWDGIRMCFRYLV